MCDCYCVSAFAMNITCDKCVLCSGIGDTSNRGWFGNVTDCSRPGGAYTLGPDGKLSEPYCEKGYRCTVSKPGIPAEGYPCNLGRDNYNPTVFNNMHTQVCAEPGGIMGSQGVYRSNHGAHQCGYGGGQLFMQSKEYISSKFEDCQCIMPGTVPRECRYAYDHEMFWAACYCFQSVPLYYRTDTRQVPREYCFQRYIQDDSTRTYEDGGCTFCGYGLFCPVESSSVVNNYMVAATGTQVLGFGQSVGSLKVYDCEPGAIGTSRAAKHVYCPGMPMATVARNCPANSHMGDNPPKFYGNEVMEPTWFSFPPASLTPRDRCYCDEGYHANGDYSIQQGDLCIKCALGYSCPPGTALYPVICPAGFYCPKGGSAIPCFPQGYGCAQGSTAQTPCRQFSSLMPGIFSPLVVTMTCV